MKSLSPNAEEFVPLVINSQAAIASSPYYVINNDSPVAHQQHHPMTLQMGQVQFGYLNPNAGVINGSVSPIAAGAIVYTMQPQVSIIQQPQQHHHHPSHNQYHTQVAINSTSPVNGVAAKPYSVYLSNGDGIGGVSMSPVSNHYLITATNDSANLNSRLNQSINMVQTTQQPSHTVSTNSFSSVQQTPQSHFSYQSGMINYMQQGQYPHSSNTFAYPSQYPQNLIRRGNSLKQSNTHNSKMNHQLSANKLKHMNSQNANMTNKKSYNNNNNNNNHRTKETFDLTKDEKDWPQLTESTKKNLKNNKVKTKASNEVKENDDDDETVSDEEVRETVMDLQKEKTPYLTDANQLKKLIKNVNFIKTTVEQHYLTENNLKQPNNHISGPVSFKDAVLTKPKPPPPPPQPIKEVSVVKKTLETMQNTSITEKEMSKTNIISSSSKPSRRSRRSRSKKNRSADDTRKSVERDNFVVDFNLKNDEFPDLSNSFTNKTLDSKITNFQKLFENKLDSNSNENDTNKQTSQITKLTNQKGNPEPVKNSVKSNKPITLDFANMISALEKGQKREKSHNKLENRQHLTRSKSLASSRIGIIPIAPLVKSNHVTAVNPLDSEQIQKRGKEREKPKAKKQSTLKKIIIKEREEKRRLRHDQLKTSGNEELTLEITGINSPVELILSPRNHKLTRVDLDNLEIQVNNKNDAGETSITDKSDLESNTNSPNKLTSQELSDKSEIGSDETNKNQSNDQSSQNAGEDEDESEKTEENENDEVMSNQLSPISQGSPISIGGYSPSPYAALNGLLATDHTLLSLEKLEEQVKQKIHSRKFREYCNQIINREIDEVCNCLLHEIARFQDRLYHKNPTKAKTKRRYVMGIREVTKHLKLQKLKCIILAPNCEKIQSKGGLDDAINLIIQTSMEQNVPFVFALGRKALGKAVNKLVPISVVGIFDYSGAEEYFKRLVDLANNAKLAYQEMVEEYEKEECENLIAMQSEAVNSQAHSMLNKDMLSLPATTNQAINANAMLYNNGLYSNHPKVPSHMAHSRTSSNGSNISIEPYFMNYHTHSRSASGNFNYGSTTTNNSTGSALTNQGNISGHVRSASGGGAGTVFSNIDLGIHGSAKHWGTHSRTPSNCSNISFISRLSEPISEVGGSMGTLYIGGVNNSNNNLAPYFSTNSSGNNQNNQAFVAVQYYNEQVRQEMNLGENDTKNTGVVVTPLTKDQTANVVPENEQNTKLDAMTVTLTTSSSNTGGVNLQLGSINEIDAGNEADNEGECNSESNEIDNKNSKQSKKLHESTLTNVVNEQITNNVETTLNLTETEKPIPKKS